LTCGYVYGFDRISQDQGGVEHFYAVDGQGSVRQLTNETGNITDTYYYTAFGEELAKSGTTVNEYRYVGEQWDPNAGFYYNRARWYDPSVGLFTSVDPWGGDPQTPMSLHRYFYANVSPMSYSDPTGNFAYGEAFATLTVAGIINATIGTTLRIFSSNREMTTQELWGDAFKDFAVGAVTAPVGGFVTKAFAPVFRGMLQPVMRGIGNLDRISLQGTAGLERWAIQTSRAFVTTNNTYPSVTSTYLGRLLVRMFPKVEWEMHHIFVQQSWYNGAPANRIYQDLVANRGLQRIGDALWNLMPLPASAHAVLSSNPIARQVLATAYYSLIVFGPTQSLWEFLGEGD
jgi:RHS repeat-associated protein